MSPDREQHFRRHAAEQPGILCANAPAEILEACAVEVEPTEERLNATSRLPRLTYQHQIPKFPHRPVLYARIA